MSIWLVCPTCSKHVRLKRFLGTLHFCLTEAEIAEKRAAIDTAKMQRDAARQNPYAAISLLGSPADAISK